jgi:hypothetical protein
MKTEDVRMTEIALAPSLTLILFSVPPGTRATNEVTVGSTRDAPAWIARLPYDAAEHDSNRRAVFAQEV